jgi:hypothetical protein
VTLHPASLSSAEEAFGVHTRMSFTGDRMVRRFVVSPAPALQRRSSYYSRLGAHRAGRIDTGQKTEVWVNFGTHNLGAGRRSPAEYLAGERGGRIMLRDKGDNIEGRLSWRRSR